MKTAEKELVLICALMALIGALGAVAFVLVFCGKTIESCDTAVLAVSYCVLSGILWGILLIFNLGK